MKFRSYAKINLTLDILGRREDGYHELDTVFQHVDLYDDIEIIPLEENSIMISCSDNSIEGENNICHRAARLFKDKFGLRQGVHIKINKRIPLGAGLSGGSSNAAAVLKGLACVFTIDVSAEELLLLGSAIGMDVAFHIYGGTCRGRGRGEIIEPLKPLPAAYAVIVYPGFQVSSGNAYSSLNYEKIGRGRSTEKFIRNYNLDDLHNDFEYSVLEQNPHIGNIIEEMGTGALLSGSGSSVFRLFNKKDDAVRCCSKMRRTGRDVFLVKTINKMVSHAEKMGVCAGVKKALHGVEAVKDSNGVFVLGKIVHNEQVVERLNGLGVRSISDYKDIEKGTVVISTHGVSDSIVEDMKSRELNVVDLTCPVVKKLHRLTKEKEQAGKKILIFGDKDHAEVRGIAGNLKNCRVIHDAGDICGDDMQSRVLFLSQTTGEADKFHSLSESVKNFFDDAEVVDTVCSATKARIKSAEHLAKSSDIVIVLGGRMSANTIRLYEICSRYCETRHVETGSELEPDWFFNRMKIGLTAGASTPDWMVESVANRLQLIV